jgi:hypothetical protein
MMAGAENEAATVVCAQITDFRTYKILPDYIHSQGLKFGIYSSPRAKTCCTAIGLINNVWQRRDIPVDLSGIAFMKSESE